MNGKKIALLTPMLQPYRLTFYEKLSKLSPQLQWIIYHGVKRAEDGRPAHSGQTNFENRGFIEKEFPLGPFTLLVDQGMYKDVVTFNPDIIIIQSITGNLTYRKIVNWAHNKNKVIINWACAWEPGRAKGLLLRFKNFFVNTFYKKGDAFLTYSTKAVQYVMDRGIEKSRISVCYNGLETDDMIRHEKEILKQAEEIRHKLELENQIVFIYVGGLIPMKRIDLLIDAFTTLRRKHNNIKLIIIGDGPLKNSVTQKLNELNDKNILYLGRIIQGVDPYFAASTCLVLPGVGGLALNQAMFWKKICIASEADGTEEDLIINGETGFRFLKDDLESLTRSMENVTELSDRDLSQMGEAARKIIDEKSNVNHMVQVFADSIAGFFPEIEMNATLRNPVLTGDGN